MTLDNKVALITGAGRGMGRAHALAMAAAGASVAVADIDGEAVEATSIAVRELGRRSVAIQADLGKLEDIDRMVTETVNALGRVDILVNNAGVTRHIPIMDVQEEDWDRILGLNAKGVFFCMQRVAREMISQSEGGRIINIASIAGKGFRNTSNVAYASSKGAVITMTQIAAHQLGGHDINVNAICPGITRTEMVRNIMAERAEQLGVPVHEVIEQQNAQIPLGRTNEPEDIAAMALFLAGPAARNITGQALNVDGGLVMH
jgi:NAD(P)-dependent dehydrogenase (short-subunit alcohol dehydrogenase family)